MANFQFSQEATKAFSVTEITNMLKGTLEQAFPSVSIEGEISNYKVYSQGHAYFTLKDENAQISAVMFRGSLSYIDFIPRDGDKVKVRGKITVYPQRGNYQIICSFMEKAGSGQILAMLQERKMRLASEGVFAPEKKKSLPKFPKTIGVVTSPTGAAIRDILNIARRRNPNVSIIIFPTLVQGAGASDNITRQIEIANEFILCDILIVGRGGGSLEDLLPFSEENVVRAVSDSKIPVISAVGHEIDWALTDFAASLRSPTPSAAAEVAIPLLTDIYSFIETSAVSIIQSMNEKLQKARLMVKSFSKDSMETQLRVLQQPLLNRFENAAFALRENMAQRLKETRDFIERKTEILEGASPQTILDRGYSVVYDENGNVIRSASQTEIGSEIKILAASGKIKATVKEKEE